MPSRTSLFTGCFSTARADRASAAQYRATRRAVQAAQAPRRAGAPGGSGKRRATRAPSAAARAEQARRDGNATAAAAARRAVGAQAGASGHSAAAASAEQRGCGGPDDHDATGGRLHRDPNVSNVARCRRRQQGLEHCDTVTAPTLKASGAATGDAQHDRDRRDHGSRAKPSLAFCAALTEVTASTIAVLPADKQTEIYNAYFSASGSAYNLTLRARTSAADPRSRPTPTTTSARPIRRSPISEIDHDNTYLIPGLKKALATNPSLKILASLWSAPARG